MPCAPGQAPSQSVSATASPQVEQGPRVQRGQQEQANQEDTPNPTAPPGPAKSPASHDGSASFTFELRFSEEPKTSFGYATLRDHAFTATGGEVVKARRLESGKNIRREIPVQASGKADLTIVLPVTTDCAAQGAVCTEDGRKLSGRLQVTVTGLGG